MFEITYDYCMVNFMYKAGVLEAWGCIITAYSSDNQLVQGCFETDNIWTDGFFDFFTGLC